MPPPPADLDVAREEFARTNCAKPLSKIAQNQRLTIFDFVTVSSAPAAPACLVHVRCQTKQLLRIFEKEGVERNEVGDFADD
ncbi:MAG: hypothetical protein LZF60_20189 [Nitrospira sp.]|nr:MAG: hypothetical protein LZF60_20189 [Nitrospira sp.]